MTTKNVKRNLQIPGEPITDKEFVKLVNIAEKGPFNTLEVHNKKMNDWIQQTYRDMETTIKINTDLITSEFIEGIKKLFPHQTVEITIQAADATEYILSNPLYAKELEDRIEAYEKKKEVISLKADELL